MCLGVELLHGLMTRLPLCHTSAILSLWSIPFDERRGMF